MTPSLQVGAGGEITVTTHRDDDEAQVVRRLASDGSVQWSYTAGVERWFVVVASDGGVYSVETTGDATSDLVHLGSDGVETWRHHLDVDLVAVGALPDGGALLKRFDATAETGDLRRIDREGRCEWALPFSGSGLSFLGADGSGAMLLMGSLADVGDALDLSGWVVRSPVPGVPTPFFLRLAPNGEPEGVRFEPGLDSYWTSGTRMDANGTLYFTGFAPVFADLGPPETIAAHPRGTFVARFDPDGGLVATRLIDASHVYSLVFDAGPWGLAYYEAASGRIRGLAW